MTKNNFVRPRSSELVIPSSFVIRHSSFRVSAAFTLIELIVVTTVIIILTGLVLSTVGYVQKKGARARAETEIAAMRSEEHTSELQSQSNLVCRLLLEKK